MSTSASLCCLPKITVICCSLIKACLSQISVQTSMADFPSFSFFPPGALLCQVFSEQILIYVESVLSFVSGYLRFKDSFELLMLGHIHDLRCPTVPTMASSCHQSPASPIVFLLKVSGMSVHLKQNKKPTHGQVNQAFDVLC